MKPTDAAKLCKFAKAACPAQAIDQDTPAAWYVLLADLRFEDAMEALVNVARKQPFVAPAEIRAEVRRLRGGRLSAFGPIPAPPSELSPVEQQQWIRDAQSRIADGSVTTPAELGVLPAPPWKQPPLELEGLTQRVPEDDRAQPPRKRAAARKKTPPEGKQ